MFGVSNMLKMAISGVVAAGAVVVVSSVRSGDDMRNTAAQLLRSGARGARWIADKADIAADYLESQDNEEYVNQQWAKVESAQHATGAL